MHITIESPDGPRIGVMPYERITDEAMLVKSLILTFALESNRGADELTLRVGLDGADIERLVSIAREFARMTLRVA